MTYQRIDNRPKKFISQLPVDYIDTSLTINTYEDVIADLGNGKPCQLWLIAVEQTNNGATNEDVTIAVNIGGSDILGSATMVSGTIHYFYVDRSLYAGVLALNNGTNIVSAGSGIGATVQGVPFTEEIGQIQVKQTSGVDATSAQIEVNIVWSKLVSV